nr:MAG TPA: hypothetical protein [Caudoviricetes sp.]
MGYKFQYLRVDIFAVLGCTFFDFIFKLICTRFTEMPEIN